MDDLKYLFIDFNAFFAGVEQHDDVRAQGRPLIVTPMRSEYTSAIAASYEARALGIKRGTKVKEARQICPDIIVRHARHDRYVQMHHALKKEVMRHLPITKVYSIDEWTCRLSRTESHRSEALKIGHQVQQGILQNVGPCLRSSVGLAPSRLLAKIAAELHKPDGMTVIGCGDLPGKLLDIDIGDIPGVGVGVRARLARAGIVDFAGIWNLQPKQARAIWGSVQGERFWYALHGFETEEPDEPEKSMIGHSRVLSRDHESPDTARIVARALLLKAASRLRHYGLFAQRISLSVKMRSSYGAARRSGERWEDARSCEASQDTFLFLELLEEMWMGLRRDLTRLEDGAGGHRLGGVTVYLHGLTKETDTAFRQTDLFSDSEKRDVMTKNEKLWAAVDALNADTEQKIAKLGTKRNTRPASGRYVNLASQQGMDLNYLGAKIAFSRVPEESEFLF